MKGRYLAVAGLVLFGAGVVCGRLLHPVAAAVDPSKTSGVRTQPEVAKPQTGAPVELEPAAGAETGSARVEVERLTSALDAARQRTAALEKKAAEAAQVCRRVKWAQQSIYQEGNGWIRTENRKLYFVGGLEPTPELLEYLSLSESTAAEFKSLCAETQGRIAAWEKEHAKVVEQTPSSVTYEIPAMGNEEKERFDGAVARLLPAADASMVSGLAQFGSGFSGPRLVSLSLSVAADGTTNYTMRESRLRQDGTLDGTAGHGPKPYTGIDSLEGRWKHLFQSEGASR